MLVKEANADQRTSERSEKIGLLYNGVGILIGVRGVVNGVIIAVPTVPKRSDMYLNKEKIYE